MIKRDDLCDSLIERLLDLIMPHITIEERVNKFSKQNDENVEPMSTFTHLLTRQTQQPNSASRQRTQKINRKLFKSKTNDSIQEDEDNNNNNTNGSFVYIMKMTSLLMGAYPFTIIKMYIKKISHV
jgi:hypothetical protein